MTHFARSNRAAENTFGPSSGIKSRQLLDPIENARRLFFYPPRKTKRRKYYFDRFDFQSRSRCVE